MKLYCFNRMDVAQCVDDLLYNLNKDLPWTMTISAEKSEDCYATIVTDVSLDDIETSQVPNYSRLLTIT